VSDQTSNRPWFQHQAAIVESHTIGTHTRIWAFAHVLAGARIGSDCNVCDHVFIENNVQVGDRVTIKSGVQLWDGVTLEDDVFVGPNATFTNDPFPRSRHRPEHFAPTVVRKGASIGANATILCGVTIGARAMVGAGAVVTRDVPPNAIVAGNPAEIRGYVDATQWKQAVEVMVPTGIEVLPVGNVTLHRLPEFRDLRGSLVPAEVARDLPFVPARLFLVHGVPSRDVRGEHAHRTLHQFLICVAGECSLVVDDGRERRELRLDTRTLGVYLPPMVWAIQYKFSPDAVLLALASAPYDPADYIRDYEEFLQASLKH
jgi:UDP-2-acetamido-3-amino-2,3-dideoxy-glucuronate N-acetyltransferase